MANPLGRLRKNPLRAKGLNPVKTISTRYTQLVKLAQEFQTIRPDLMIYWQKEKPPTGMSICVGGFGKIRIKLHGEAERKNAEDFVRFIRKKLGETNEDYIFQPKIKLTNRAKINELRVALSAWRAQNASDKRKERFTLIGGGKK